MARQRHLRIIGGEHRGRRLDFVDAEGVRPTPDRVRETLFNWLQYVIRGAHCLDLFAGSGILGIESASRGAASIDLVESNLRAARQIRRAVEGIRLNRAEVYNLPAERFLEQAKDRYDVIFLDPPYGKGLLKNSCRILEKKALLADNAHIYLESEQQLAGDDIPDNWQIVHTKKAGQVFYHLALR